MTSSPEARYNTWFEQRFRNRLDRLVEAANPASDTDRDLRDAFDSELTSHGNSEEKIAKSHEGRELIELIQNARDAINDNGEGEVYIGILDAGILVANTGEPFDLIDKDTERAVKMIGESNKTEAGESGVDMSSDSIGHIGVGLKSTVAVGDDFEVWSRRNDGSLPLRIRYSRAYMTAAVIRRFGHHLPAGIDITAGSIGPFADRAPAELFTPDGYFVEEPHELPDDLGKVPQFWFPWPLDPERGGPSNRTLASRANELMTAPGEMLGAFDEPPAEPFQTAVFIEYRDENWRKLLEEFDIPTPIEPPSNTATRANELWERLAYAGNRGEGFDPETLVNLGKIDDIYLERISEGETQAAEQWNLTESTPERVLPVDGVRHRRYDVEITAAETELQCLTYDSFEADWESAKNTRPRIVIERPRIAANGTARRRYPLHLYYPISSTAGALPVCFHGRFRVTTERKDLSRSEAEHNREVLRDGVELFGRIAAGAATLACDSTAAAHWDRYPWLLVPEPSEEPVGDPEAQKDTTDLLAWFRAEIISEVRTAKSIATSAGPQSVSNAVLHPSRASLRGLAASLEVVATLDGESERSSPSVALPTAGTLRTAIDRFGSEDSSASQAARLRALIGDTRAETTLKSWAAWLGETLNVTRLPEPPEGETLPVKRDRGLEMFHGLVELITAAAADRDENDTVRDILTEEWLREALAGVCILPCEQAGEGTVVDLVAIEPTPIGQITRGRKSSRTVLWGLNRESLSVDYPPKYGEFGVFFLDQAAQSGDVTEVLKEAGDTQTWGVRSYSDFPDLFEAFLQTFRQPGSTIGLDSLAALTQYVPEIETESKGLSQGELSIGNRETMIKSASKSNPRRSLRLRLGVRRATLDAAGFPDAQLADLTLPGSWQRLRQQALYPEEEADSATGDDPVAENVLDDQSELDINSIPEPASDAWAAFPLELAGPDAQGNLARTLSLLGVSSLPGVRYLPLHGDAHPRLDQETPGWHPEMWDDAGQPEWVRDHRQGLQAAIEASGYTDVVTSYKHHPRMTIRHAYSCDEVPTSPDASHQRAYLVGWTWFNEEQLSAFERQPAAVRSLLGRYSADYQRGLLTTKWICRRYSKCSMRDHLIPTVANLQLRQLPIWGDVVERTETLEEAEIWEGEADRLDCAVIRTGSGGRPGWRLFPHVARAADGEALDDELLETLGVVPLEKLGVTGAEYRLQRVQAELSETPGSTLPSEGEPVPLEIPSTQQGNWKRAYSQLLHPILDAWETTDENSVDEQLDRLFTRLTHLPVKRDDDWYAASISWIREHGGTAIWRYPERNPPRWVTAALATAAEGDSPGYRIERPTIESGFQAFAKALGVREIKATKPSLSAADFGDRQISVTELIDPATLDEWKERLHDRLPLLLAASLAQSDEGLKEATDELRTAIENLAVVEQLPGDTRDNLPDPSSITYDLKEEAPASAGAKRGIALVKSEIDEPNLGNLAQGFALLLEQFSHHTRIRRILDVDEYGDAKRLFEGTLPIANAEAFLNRQRRTDIRTRLEIGADLLRLFEAEQPSIENPTKELEALDEEADELFETLAAQIREERSPPMTDEGCQRYIAHCQAVEGWLQELIALVIDPGENGVENVRREITRTVPDEHQQTLIEWLVGHRSRLPGELGDAATLRCCRRLATVDDIWEASEAEMVETPAEWQAEIEARTSSLQWAATLPDYAVAETHGTYWIDLVEEGCVESLVEVFEGELAEEIPAETAAAVQAYVLEGESLPTETSQSMNHKARAFAAASNLSSEDLSSLAILDRGGRIKIKPWKDEIGPGTGAGSGPVSFTGRGEIAEVAVTIEVLNRVSDWLSDDADRGKALVEQFDGLLQTQMSRDIDYRWHTTRRWRRELVSLIKRGSDQLVTDFIDWKSLIDDGRSLDDLASVSILDVSGERGPGFDLIDPLDNGELAPRPIEIKSVTSTEPPFSIRLTTNEYQQCKLHIVQSDHPYVLRLVYVPTDNPTVQAATDVGSYEINTESDLEDLLGRGSFDMQVRGGYISPRFEERPGE